MAKIRDLRMMLDDEQIKTILARFGVFPVYENPKSIIYPTCCHNLEGGSPKLYYYRKDKIFRCYTECNEFFDIFDLLMRMKHLRGEDLSLPEALRLAGLDNEITTTNEDVNQDLEYLDRLKATTNFSRSSLEVIDESILDIFTFNEDGLRSWIKEGITIPTLKKFGISYDIIHNCITIPNRDDKGRLVGVRGRFLSEKAIAKYMPLKVNNRILRAPVGKLLYGYFENQSKIKSTKIAVLVEGEKSVLKMESFYPNNNIALATYGRHITIDQLDLLIQLGINEAVIAYDKEYTTKQSEEYNQTLTDYKKIGKLLGSYFTVSFIMDEHDLLELKDSPLDRGIEKFEFLMKNRKRLE